MEAEETELNEAQLRHFVAAIREGERAILEGRTRPAEIVFEELKAKYGLPQMSQPDAIGESSMNETEQREALIRRAYAAFNARDIDAALATMQSDVEWPNGMEGGYVYGHDEIRRYWTRQWGMIDPHVEPLGMTTGADGCLTVEVRQVVHDRGGALLMDVVLQHVYRFEGGLIAHMEIIT